jgi:hypothetical protein
MTPHLTEFLAQWWVSYLAFGITALLGGILAVHNPPKESTGVRWSYVAAFVVLFLLGLVVTRAQHEDSVTQAKMAEANARKNVRDEIKAAVAPYQATIDALRQEQAAQAKDVLVIKGSNIVTGKNPVKVEVINPSSLRGDTSEQLPSLNWTQEAEGSINGHARTIIKFRVGGLLALPAFIAICDHACKTVGAGPSDGLSQTVSMWTKEPNVAGAFFKLPRPLAAGLPCFMRLESADETPIRVLTFRILPESEIPMSLK